MTSNHDLIVCAENQPIYLFSNSQPATPFPFPPSSSSPPLPQKPNKTPPSAPHLTSPHLTPSSPSYSSPTSAVAVLPLWSPAPGPGLGPSSPSPKSPSSPRWKRHRHSWQSVSCLQSRTCCPFSVSCCRASPRRGFQVRLRSGRSGWVCRRRWCLRGLRRRALLRWRWRFRCCGVL